MSYHIPSEDEENRTLHECGQVHRQLYSRDNPYGLVVDPTLQWPPPPLFEGQELMFRELSHSYGRTLRCEFLRCVRQQDGDLVWRTYRVGNWL